MVTYNWDPISAAVIAALAPAITFLDSMGFIGEMTHIVKTPALDAALLPTAASLGMDLTIFKVRPRILVATHVGSGLFPFIRAPACRRLLCIATNLLARFAARPPAPSPTFLVVVAE